MVATALTTALNALTAASAPLQVTRPSTADVKAAKDAAKNAHEILDAAHKLRERGIYTVADAPQEEPPLFGADGAPAPGADVTAPPQEATPMPCAPPQGTLGCTMDAEVVEPPTEDERKVFAALMDEFKTLGLEDDLDKKTWNKHRKAWEALFATDHRAATEKLKERLDHWHPLAWGPDEERPQPQEIDKLDAEVDS
jgi:hypothetical protein